MMTMGPGPGDPRTPDGIVPTWENFIPDNYIRRRTHRIIFIPWNTVEGAEWTSKSQQWRNFGHFNIIHYAPGQKCLLLDMVSRLEVPSAEIYIRGHGRPGCPYVQTRL